MNETKRIAVCIKSNDDPFSYGFIKGKSYYYYRNKLGGYFVIYNTLVEINCDKSLLGINCGYDQEHFDESFIDIKKYRKNKIKEINNHK